MGVTWRPDNNQCFLKYTMQPTDYPGYEVDSAVRMSGPTGDGPSLNQLANSGFDSILSPWTSSTDEDGDSFSIVNNQAYVNPSILPTAIQIFPLSADLIWLVRGVSS